MAVLPTGIGPVTGGYQIQRSLRFNSADSAYLNRTPASASNRRTWTWSGWVKKSVIAGDYPPLFNAGQSVPDTVLRFTDTDTISAILENGGGGTASLVTTQVFRDPSAWYHIVWAVDTTNATANNRHRLYVNGTEITAFGTRTNPSQNFDTNVNNTVQHRIGGQRYASFFNGYLTEVNFIDGSALTPSDFGETDSATGVWKPKAYTGTYGTNGFELNFSDNSNNTAATLGKDSSGNGNNWTPNNFSVTAGTGNDSLVDTPTSYGSDTGVGGEVRGNYCTLNPLSKTSPATLANGNLDVSTTSSSANISIAAGTLGVTSGKWYWEVVGTAVDSTRMAMYVCDATRYGTMLTASTGAYGYSANGNKIQGDGTNWYGTASAYGNSWTTNDVIGVALDLDNGKVWFSKNGTWQASGDPAAGTNAAFTGLSGAKTCGLYLYTEGSATTAVFNLGQRPFAYTAPSGFKALCTQNLPTPTIGATSTTQAGKYFNPVLYTGNSSGGGRAITGVGFQPDLVWLKTRSTAYHHQLHDAVRGASAGALYSSLTNAQDTSYPISSFNSDGFTLASSLADYGSQNANGTTYVAWNWKANGAGSTNTAGTITSTVSANTTSGFSIVTYTGTGSNATVGHGLGVAPSMIILKGRTNADQWFIWHNTFTSSQYIYFNTTAIVSGANPWNSTLPTSTLFSLGTDAGVNGNGTTYVAYCFANVEGYSRAFSYTGNGSTDGPFVFTNFRPAFVLIKRTDAVENWFTLDYKRDTYNGVVNYLRPNLSDAEAAAGTPIFDFLSNGFKLRNSASAYNASGGTYIYAAFAENPFKYSLGR